MTSPGDWTVYNTFCQPHINDNKLSKQKRLQQEFGLLSNQSRTKCIPSINQINALMEQANNGQWNYPNLVKAYRNISANAPYILRVNNLEQRLEHLAFVLNQYAHIKDLLRSFIAGYTSELPPSLPANNSIFRQCLESRMTLLTGVMQQGSTTHAEVRRDLRNLKNNAPPARKTRDAISARERNRLIEAAPGAASGIPFPPTPPRGLTRGGWMPVTMIADGNAKIVLNVRVDNHNTIVDRVVSKSTPLGANSWPLLQHWRTDIQGAQGGKLPLEWLTQALATMPAESRYVLRPVGQSECDERTFTQRLYMEYAPLGDLRILRIEYRSKNWWIPEPFLWSLLEAFVDTGLIFEKGGITQGINHWMQIVHRDLKGENVFLGPNDTGRYTKFPKPLIGDFGLAFMTKPTDPTNPGLWTEAGTEGFKAPEQLSIIDEHTGVAMDDFKILSPCNVWGFALILYELITLRTIQPNDQADEEPHRYTFDLAVTHYYTEPLLDIVTRCLAWNPKDRPTFEQLHAWLERKVRHNDHDPNVINARNGAFTPYLQLRPDLDPAHWRIGFAVPRVAGQLNLALPR